MSDAKLKTRIKRTFKAHLEPLGFSLASARHPQRRLEGLRQGIDFQPGTGHLDRRYTMNVYWSFTHPLDQGVSMDPCKRIGHLAGGVDRWFSREDAELEADYEAAEDLLLNVALPHLTRHDSIARIVAAAESGALSAADAYGQSVCWRAFNSAFCYAWLGQVAEAIRRYRTVVTEHSSDPYPWVQARCRVAMKQIERLSGRA